jgi:hypothetical protein
MKTTARKITMVSRSANREPVKREALTGMTVLHLVFPTTDKSCYMDMPNATTAQALKVIVEILGRP